MSGDELEFAISQYLDGTLSAEETAALEAHLAADADVRRLLAEYQKLNLALKASPAVPELAWDKLASHLSRTVAEEFEQLEFTISQYVDGTLAAAEVPALEARLRDDAGAQRIVVEQRRLTELLQVSALPTVQWDRLAAHLSEVVAESADPAPIKLFARPWVRAVTGLAMAACLTFITSVGIRSYLHRDAGTPQIAVKIGDGSANRVVARVPIDVQISGPEKPAGAAVAEITFGAGPDTATFTGAAYAQGIVTHSPRSLIATNVAERQDTLAQDTSVMPY